MKTSTKLSNLRRELVNEYYISDDYQQKIIDIRLEIETLEKAKEAKCGEGKCGEGKMEKSEKTKEGKCGGEE